MALETGTYISDLVSTNPVGTDTVDKADDHLRLIKSTIKATFPNITGAVTPTHTDLNKLSSSGNPQFATIELGAATDTTLSRVSAGVMAVEGKRVVTEDVSGNAAITGMVVPASSFLRNRIINGDMRIDQRNAGASVVANSNYSVDRWKCVTSLSSKFTMQQSSTAPTGFNKSLLVTSSSAYSVLSSDTFGMVQVVEGFNAGDFMWGTASASTVTLSFWVRSSLTGTFGGSITNGSRSYPYSYTISSANTWEQKTVTIPGDTTGTWSTDNSAGFALYFGLGSGSTFTGTSGSWQAGNFVQPTSTVSVVGTNAATWYVTGVQLEAGSAATPFERRQFGQELALCQRYFYSVASIPLGFAIDAARPSGIVTHKVTMRTAPTATNGTFVASGGGPGTVSLSGGNTVDASKFFNSGTAWTVGADITISVNLSSEL